MEIAIKEQVIATIVEHELEAAIEIYWQAVSDMVVRPVVMALILNQLQPSYATSIRGRKYQIKDIEPQIAEIRALIPRMVRETNNFYNPETDKLLPKPINVTELIVKENVQYVLEQHFKRVKNHPIEQIEAMTLNQLPMRYAATERGFNRLKLELNKNRGFKIEMVRRNANTCIYDPRIDQPITLEVRTSVVFAQQNNKDQTKKERLRSKHGGNFISIR